MTDKELKKLNRLELLELLLESSKENSQLKEEIGRLRIENKTSQNIEVLSEMTRQMEDSIKHINSLADVMRGSSVTIVSSDSREYEKSQPSSGTDVDIYKRLLAFFATNEEKIDILPQDVGKDVRARIKSLLEKRKTD